MGICIFLCNSHSSLIISHANTTYLRRSEHRSVTSLSLISLSLGASEDVANFGHVVYGLSETSTSGLD